MNKTIQIILVLLAVLSISCIPKTSDFTEVKSEKDTEVVVYIYRPHSMSNIMVSPDLLVDNKKQTEIKNNSYSYILVPQGKHVIKLDLAGRYSGMQMLDLNIKNTTYVRVNTSLKFETGKPYSRSFSIEKIKKEIALPEIRKTTHNNGYIKKIAKNKLKNDEAVKKDQFSISKTRNPFGK